MRIPLLSLAGTLLLTAVLLPQAAARTEDEDTDRQAAEEQQKLATLFRAMQGADVKNRRWVVLDVGPLDDRGERKGWLIEERSDTLKLLDEHGSATIFRKPCKDEARPKTERARFPIGASSSGGRRVVWGVRDGDYAAFCRKHLAKPLPDLDRKRTGVWAFIAARSDLVSVILGTAQYSCWADQAGERELASKLLQRAKEGHKLYQDRYVGEDTKGPLHRFVANRFALGMRSRAISAAHSGAPRPEVLRDWERLAAIPYHAEREQAKAMVGHYRSLIAEDRAWREPEASKLAKMSATEKVAYWMHHLRDADVKQSFDPGMCWVVSEWDPFQRGDEKKPNPAVELKKLGMAAVPELIAHLDDARPTRCRGHWRSYEADSYYLLCYGDCCQQVFESITGRTIYERKDTNGYPIKDGEGRECRARAERWWRDYQTKGEKHVLVEGVEAGDRDSPEQARRLVARYPAAAIEPIIRGARRSKEESVRTSLVKSADKLNGDAVTAFLREEVKGPHRTSRVAAAQALVRREHEEGIRALTGEWSGLRWEKWDSFHDERRIDSLISALAGCGIPESVRVLARDFRATPVPVRARIIKTLGELKKDVRGRPLSQAVENAVEELLVAALADEDEEGSSWFGPSGKSMSDPAIGDLAARALVGRWDRADLFDFYAPLGVRQRQRVAVHNVWRKRQGQEPLPLPAAPKIEPVP